MQKLKLICLTTRHKRLALNITFYEKYYDDKKKVNYSSFVRPKVGQQ